MYLFGEIPCTHCIDAADVFDDRNARQDLRAFRRRGPRRSTRLLADGLEAHGSRSVRLLDVGGGIGALRLLLRERLSGGTMVDASPGYLTIAREVAADEGIDAFDYVTGDFAELADGLPTHDFVTLDRVVCCYPDADRLLAAAASRSQRAIGLVYPRRHLLNRILFPLLNLKFRLQRSAFRVFLHRPDEMRRRLSDLGFKVEYERATPLWSVAVFGTVR